MPPFLRPHSRALHSDVPVCAYLGYGFRWHRHPGACTTMKRIRPSLRPARSQLRLDALEDRVLLSVLASSPSLVGGAGPMATQSGTVVSSSPSDFSQATDTSNTGTT